MQLVNHTRFPAELFRTVIDINNDRFAAALVARVTFDLTPQGPVPAAEQPWIVSHTPWENEHGQMDGDEVLYRGGVDVFLFGQAYAPRGAAELELVVEVGTFQRRVAVIGDRFWIRRGRDLVPSSPAPFATMPLTLARAFGGKDQWDGLEVSYPDNAEGKGYVVEERDAEGKPLPNLEDPLQRIQRWNDRPEPVGLGVCPMTCGLRARNGIVLDDQSQIREFKPTLFNSAFPKMIAQKVLPGDLVRVTHVLPSGHLQFRIPDLRLQARLEFGQEVIERPLAIDQLGIESERRRIFITYRYPFRYVMYRLQKRGCELFCASELAGGAK